MKYMIDNWKASRVAKYKFRENLSEQHVILTFAYKKQAYFKTKNNANKNCV